MHPSSHYLDGALDHILFAPFLLRRDPEEAFLYDEVTAPTLKTC